MSTKILLTLLLTGFFAGCSKDEYNTKPTLKITSVSTNVVEINESLIFDLKVTDKEGDVTDSLFFKKVRLNKRVRQTLRDSFALKIPDAPKSTNGTVRVTLDYNNYLVSAVAPVENDTLVFKFALKDEAKNISDTVTSEQIVIKRQ
jgi:hypothetical protein